MIISTKELEERYKDFLNEYHGTVDVCGYYYDSAYALKLIDPIAYEQDFLEWLNSELGETLWETADGQYTDEEPKV